MAAITVDDVRLFIKDSPQSNYKGEAEFTTPQIERAIDFTISDFNSTPPLITGFTKNDFPYLSLLLLGVVSHLYKGAAIHQERNHLPASSGGVSVDDSAHANPYLQLANDLRAEYEQKKSMIKISLNMAQGWGGIGSEYYGYV